VCLCDRTIIFKLPDLYDLDIWHAGSFGYYVKFEGEGQRSKFKATERNQDLSS